MVVLYRVYYSKINVADLSERWFNSYICIKNNQLIERILFLVEICSRTACCYCIKDRYRYVKVICAL